MHVPPSVPRPEAFFLAAFFDFGDVETHRWIFWASVAAVPISFAAYFLTRNNTEKNLLVIQVFFDTLAFPLMTKMTSVFSCTSSEVFVKRDGRVEAYCRFADPSNQSIRIVHSEQCMDDAPDVACWGSEHLVY
eukprot:COSAG02_NODE_29133_length_575_cov_1.222689_1_plen_132_part_01